MGAKEYLPGLLNGLAGITVLLTCFLVESRLSLPQEIARTVGILVVFGGMLLVIWAAFFLQATAFGEVKPRLNTLVKDGPYRFVRHPMYLGMTIALIGATIALRSWSGFLGVFLLFLPSEVYRAHLEEKELARKFGAEWENYAKQTNFILPFSRNNSLFR